ncbi:MAG: multidrug effflux MFS transporter [Gammaproteobacteria bacterium]|nr:multidrug effflux MFS transporter [Gammaproteobacteria bacterium]
MKSKQTLFTILLLLGSIGQVAADLYLPSLPAISTSLAVSINSVQWSVSAYMWGFALSQLIYGPLSDGIGRKKPLLFGMSLALLGSIICLSAQSIDWLIIGRFTQGIGAGSGVILTRVIMRDIYSGSQLAKFGSYLSVAGVPIMAGAPLMGGIIEHILGWRANFVLLTLYAFISILYQLQ